MSQHEVEAVVERAILLLSRGALPPERLRAYYASLFEFQGCFDTGFTHFRTLDALMAARFVYRIALSEHPDFETARDYFEALDQFTFVEVPGRQADGSYFKRPHLYYDAGSPLWQRLVELGRLRGVDALPLAPVSFQEAFLAVAERAEQADDVPLIACCYRLLLWGLVMSLESARAQLSLRDDATILALRRIVKRTDALAIEFSEPMLRDGPPDDEEDLDEIPILGWWFDVSDAVPLS